MYVLFYAEEKFIFQLVFQINTYHTFDYLVLRKSPLEKKPAQNIKD